MTPAFDEVGAGPDPVRLYSYIGGEWHDEASSEAMQSGDEIVEDPATLQQLATYTEASEATVDHAVTSAHDAFRTVWRGTSPVVRAQLLAAAAAAIRRDSALLARLETLDTGKPIGQARGDVEMAARYFEFYAGVADKIYGSAHPSNGEYWAYELREPYGVVLHITPWNSPISQMCRGVAPCLAAGNTVVVKPSELTPLTSLAVAQILVDAGLPPGVCNVVPGRGATTGAAAVRHPLTAHVTFTGSVATGRAVLHMAADKIIGCNLELGGKSPTLVLPDADLAAAVRAGALAVVRNAGQSCFATTRLIVHRSIEHQFSEQVAAHIGALTIGQGLDDPDLGPLVSQQQLDKVLGAIDNAQKQGACLAAGGDRPKDLAGHFVTPALLTNVTNDMDVARNEVFGPVQSVLAYDDIDEAIEIANDSTYGLAAGIFTRDLQLAHHLAARLEAGQVQINQYPLGGVDTAFGGYKQSGIGREKGVEALVHYTQLKTVIVKS